ncbi:MAG TPA: hypothetical protein VNB22_01375 [Pyrinomonadaceae bacterium]|nr:hypothetical protein [Pyrinomonadaceae bacterium]
MAPRITPKQRNNSVTTLQRVTKNDRITDSFNTYGDLIWAIAGNLTDSEEDAEKVVREIFLDLWHNSDRAAADDFDELIFISIITRRHLLERTIKS